MSSKRTTATIGILAAAVLFIVLVPLPVSRVRQTALVEVRPEAIQKVFVPASAILDKLQVRDGQRVEKDQVLAEFRSFDMENEREEALAQVRVWDVQIKSLQYQAAQAKDKATRDSIEVELSSAEGRRGVYQRMAQGFQTQIERLVLRAPQAGIVMSPPHIDEVGKLWEKDLSVPFCGIGDPTRLQARMPVGPADRRLLHEDWGANPDLPVTIRVQGRDADTWSGRIVRLDESEAHDVPPALTSKFGGPLAVKPSTRPNEHIPQSQQYLVWVEFQDSDAFIAPGTLAQVKVHCRWRTCGWLFWRWVSSTFDVGLW